ncbi:MAG: hypothetical protein ACOX6V_05635 [Patescibacteria group bacterium]|jgi:hypothetical protein
MIVPTERAILLLDEAARHINNTEIGNTRRDRIINTIDLWHNEGIELTQEEEK